MNMNEILKATMAWLVPAILLLMVAGCSTPEVETNSSPIRIGVVLSLSGENATYGQDCLKGIQMSVDQANVMGGVKGRKIELAIEDDGTSTVRTMEAVRKLASDGTIMAIIGGTTSKLALAGGNLAQELGIPFMSALATNASVTAIGSYVSRICFTDPYQGAALADYSYNFLRFRRLGIIFDPGDEYSLGLATYFKKHYLEQGGEVLFELFQSGPSLDSVSIMAKIKDTKPDAVFLPGYHQQAAELARLVKQNGLRVPMLGGDGWESPEFLQAISGIFDNNDHVFVASHFSADNAQPLVQRFVADYKSRNSVRPTASSALGYDAADVICEALRRTPRLSHIALSESINSTSDYNGVTGTISLNEKRNPVKEVVILRVVNGRFVFESTVTVR